MGNIGVRERGREGGGGEGEGERGRKGGRQGESGVGERRRDNSLSYCHKNVPWNCCFRR